MAHALASTTLTDSPSVSVTSHIVGIFALYFVSSIQFVAVPLYSISDLYANSLYSFTLRKRSCEVLSLHTPSVTVDRSQLWTIQLQQNEKKSWKSHVWGLSKHGKQQVSPFYHVALYIAHVRTFIWMIMSSTRNRSIATNWRKNSMIGASIDTSRMALA